VQFLTGPTLCGQREGYKDEGLALGIFELRDGAVGKVSGCKGKARGDRSGTQQE